MRTGVKVYFKQDVRIEFTGRGLNIIGTVHKGMLRQFFSYYRPHRRLFLLDFFCAVFSGLLELVFPLAVRAYVDTFLPSQNWGLILGAAVGLLAIYLLNTGLQYIV